MDNKSRACRQVNGNLKRMKLSEAKYKPLMWFPAMVKHYDDQCLSIWSPKGFKAEIMIVFQQLCYRNA